MKGEREVSGVREGRRRGDEGREGGEEMKGGKEERG